MVDVQGLNAVLSVATGAKHATWQTLTTATNVAWHGAKGDNSTDDTAAFVDARNAAGPGGIVFVPPTSKSYILSNLALNVANQTWVIAPGATLKLKSAANGPIFTISANGVTVTGGGVIDGNYANQTSTFHSLCVVGGGTATDVTFDGVTIQNANGYGIGAGTNAENVSGFIARNCVFKNTQYDAINVGSTGLTADITDIAFIYNKIYNNNSSLVGGGLGISIIGNTVDGFYARRVTATGNRIECYPIGTTESGYGDWAAGVHFSGVVNGTIAGNAIFGCTLPITIPDCQEITITGNSIEGYSGYGIEVPCATTLTSGVTISANTVIDTDPRSGAGFHSQFGISVSASAGATRNVTITGNHVTQVTTSGYSIIGVGSSGNTVDHITITGNVLRKTGGGGGIITHSVPYVVISGNDVDCGGSENNVIWLDSGGAGGTYVAKWAFTGNMIANYGSGSALVYGSGTEDLTYVMIANNTFFSAVGASGVTAASSGVLASPFLNANNIGP